MVPAMRKFSAGIFRYVPLLLLAVAWELLSRCGVVSSYALPPLTTILVAWAQLLGDPDYFWNVGASLARASIGLGLAVGFGIVLGTAMASLRWMNILVSPIVELFYPMPKTALIPLTIIWFGIGDGSKVFLIFIGCLLPIAVATFNGVRGVERTLMWSAASLGAPRWKIIRDVAFRGAVPDVLAGGRTALALAFVLLVSSELLMSNEGLGYLIRIFGDGSQYPKMFACSLSVMLFGFMADQAYQTLSRSLLRWRT
jgi:NitT/TauT family transport system permease protein